MFVAPHRCPLANSFGDLISRMIPSFLNNILASFNLSISIGKISYHLGDILTKVIVQHFSYLSLDIE